MGSNTGISWTDKTFNPWWGCTKVSPACDNCYAETMASNRKMDVWGPGTPRKQTSLKNRSEPLKWNKDAAANGIRYRVFTLSMGDVMDGEVHQEWREELWALIDSTPNLDWQLLTKRPENYRRFLPQNGFKFRNVWFGITAENQQYYDLRWPTLAKLKDRFPDAPLWISYEPALGPLTTTKHDLKPDWIIFGGESGPGFRQMDIEWAKRIQEECEESGTAFFMKQVASKTLQKAKELVPATLRIQQWPEAPQSTTIKAKITTPTVEPVMCRSVILLNDKA